MPDCQFNLKWSCTSSITQLISRFLPSDTYRITKKNKNLRIDSVQNKISLIYQHNTIKIVDYKAKTIADVFGIDDEQDLDEAVRDLIDSKGNSFKT